MRSKIPKSAVDQPSRRSGRASKDLLECGYCDKTFSTQSNLSCHEYIHKLHKHEPKVIIKPHHACKQCKKSFSGKSDLKNHVCSLSSADSQTLYECKVCHKPFMYKHYLSMHMENHETEQPFECKECGMGFNEKDEFDQHQYIHLENELVKCSRCSETFHFKSFLDNHERVHEWVDSLEESFDCDESKLINQCDRMNPYRTMNTNYPIVVIVDATKTHQVKFNYETESTVEIETESKIKQNDIIKVDDGLKLDPKSSVDNFITSQMSAISISSGSVTDDKPERGDALECKESDCVEQNHNYQLVHSIDDISNKCIHCKMTFDENDKKLKHECLEHKPLIVLRHSDAGVVATQKDQCKDYSPNIDISPDSMKPIAIEDNPSNMLNVLGPEDKSKSPIAHRTRSTKANHRQILTSNLMKKSSKKKGKRKRKFICNQCNRKFKTSTNFQRHKIVHTNERPYKCQFCKATYRRSDHLLRHERQIHLR